MFHANPASAWIGLVILSQGRGKIFRALLERSFFGRMFDRYGIQIIVLGILVSLLALPFGFLDGPGGVYISVACWATGLGAQDATLRAGISQVVSMNKRGTAFGAFNAAYGVLWFVGSVTMGVLYDFSLLALVIFGVVVQAAAAMMFFWLRKPLSSSKEI